MSWLGALAGGVETLLDRVDQAAGEALKDADDESTNIKINTRPTAIVSASAYSSFAHVNQHAPPPSSTSYRVPVGKQ